MLLKRYEKKRLTFKGGKVGSVITHQIGNNGVTEQSYITSEVMFSTVHVQLLVMLWNFVVKQMMIVLKGVLKITFYLLHLSVLEFLSFVYNALVPLGF